MCYLEVFEPSTPNEQPAGVQVTVPSTTWVEEDVTVIAEPFHCHESQRTVACRVAVYEYDLPAGVAL